MSVQKININLNDRANQISSNFKVYAQIKLSCFLRYLHGCCSYCVDNNRF